ncbi:DNA repair helicase (rad3) [Colletotrichum sp. SAR 10_86]|nr:DNA repair helicase (rad3) [Colletotrichum sp. SAR 10_76]KAI8233770.1 DNA repair helicase (rad3) [Colletotrichum sp. SAR 10_86]
MQTPSQSVLHVVDVNINDVKLPWIRHPEQKYASLNIPITALRTAGISSTLPSSILFSAGCGRISVGG